MLYPLKFKPILTFPIWGGQNLVKAGRDLPQGVEPGTPVGESWEVSGVDGSVSVVTNGFLESNDLQELIEVYMGDLVGEKIYEKYGLEFPVLIKFIDARDVLSVQVHPDDELSEERHGQRGKTEMWYVVDCEPGASLYVGFKEGVTREDYLKAVEEGKVSELLQRYEVRKGDTFFIPAGTVHAIGAGLLVAEIQETSDITYRIDDWGRVGTDGKPREMHVEEALDAIDFSFGKEYLKVVAPQPNTVRELVSSPYFTTNIIHLDGEMNRDYARFDSFVAYVCTEGEFTVNAEGNSESVSEMSSVLIPAEIDEVRLSGKATLLEVFIK